MDSSYNLCFLEHTTFLAAVLMLLWLRTSQNKIDVYFYFAGAKSSMKHFITTIVIIITALSSGLLATVSMKIARSPTLSVLNERQLLARSSIAEVIDINITSGGYFVKATVGTPGQDVHLLLDTGSSDTWVLDSSADICNKDGGCVTPCKSLSYPCMDIV